MVSPARFNEILEEERRALSGEAPEDYVVRVPRRGSPIQNLRALMPPEPDEEAVDRMLERLQAPRPVDLAAIGFDKLTPGHLALIEETARQSRTAGDVLRDAKGNPKQHAPFLGAAESFKEIVGSIRDFARWKSGEATQEEQLRVALMNAREKAGATGMAQFTEAALSIPGLGAEFAVTGGASAVARGTARAGIGAILSAAKKEALQEMSARARQSAVGGLMRKAAPFTGSLVRAGEVSVAQQAVPKALFGETAGAWDVASARAAFRTMKDWTDEEVAVAAAMLNEEFPDWLNSRVPMHSGFIEAMIQNTIEQSGAVLARIPPFHYLAALQAKGISKLTKGGDDAVDAWFTRVGNITAIDGWVQESMEEIVGNATTEAYSAQDPAAFIDGLPQDMTELAVTIFASGLPGAMRTGVQAGIIGMQRLRRQEAAEERAAKESTAGEQTAERKEADTSAGGDVSTPGEATVARQDVEPGVSSVDPVAVQAFADASGLENAQAVQPGDEREAAAAQLALNLGREIVLVSGQGTPRASGMIDGQGRMFVHAETASPLEVTVHELGHKVADELEPEGFAEEVAKVEAVVPGFVERYTTAWRRRAERADPGSSQVAPSVQVEEGFATAAEQNAALIAYSTTPEGARDLEIVAQEAPGLFRRIVDAVRDLLGRLPGNSVRAAKNRIEAITGQRPNQQAAQLSLALSDLYTRTLGPQVQESGQGATDTVRARTGAETTAQPEDGTTALLGGLQAEADRLGVPRVQIVPRSSAAIGAGTGAASGIRIPDNAFVVGSSSATTVQADATDVSDDVGPRPYASSSGARTRLNNPLATPEARAALDGVDGARTGPSNQTRAEAKKTAKERLWDDYDGTRLALEQKLGRGDFLDSWETHAVVEIMDDLSRAAFRGEPGAMGDLVTIGEAYREVRGRMAASLSTVAGRGRPAADGKTAREVILDMLSIPTRRNRLKLREIREEASEILRRVSRGSGGKTMTLRTAFQEQQAQQRGQRFSPNAGLRFAPNEFNDRGQPISEERLEYLRREEAKIKADEARRMERAAEALRAAGFDPNDMGPDRMLDPNDGWKIRNIVGAAKATAGEKLLEYRYASMLSGPRTHIRNMTGNAVQLFLEGPAQKTAEAFVNLAIRDKNSPAAQELAWWTRGFFAHLRPAFRNLVEAYRTEGPAWELDLQRNGVEMGEYGTRLDRLEGVKSMNPLMRGLRALSLNTLQAGDEFIKTLAGGSEAWSLAFRKAHGDGLRGKEREARAMEILSDFSDPVWTESLYKARAVTFQDKGGKGSQWAEEVLGKFVNGLDDLGEQYIRTPIGTLLIPFRRTPIRIAATALRRTPLQSFVVPFKAMSGAYAGDRGALVRDLADSMIAWGITLWVMEMIDLEDDDGLPFITGARADSKGTRNLDYRTAPPMSIRIDGVYHDYSGIEPFSTSVGMMIAAGKQFNETGNVEFIGAMLKEAAAQTKDKTFMRTIGDVLALADGNRTGKDALASFLRSTLVTPMVPNAYRQVARESDEVLRERRTRDQGEIAFWLDGVVPTSSDPVAQWADVEPKKPKYDLWGRPIEKPYARRMATDIAWRLLHPMLPKSKIEDMTRIDVALRQWRQKVDSGAVEDGKYTLPSQPGKGFSIDGTTYTYTPSEYERYSRDAGQAAAKAILADEGINLDDLDQKGHDAILKHIYAERRKVRDEIKEERAALASD